MSSKLALLLRKKTPSSGSGTTNNNGPPAKRQKQAAASKPRAEHQQQQQGRQQHQDKSALQRAPAAGQTVSSHDDGIDKDDEDDSAQPAAAEAYSQLVGLLSSQRTALGAALKQRQLQELEGASEEGESESDGDGEDTQVGAALRHHCDYAMWGSFACSAIINHGRCCQNFLSAVQLLAKETMCFEGYATLFCSRSAVASAL